MSKSKSVRARLKYIDKEKGDCENDNNNNNNMERFHSKRTTNQKIKEFHLPGSTNKWETKNLKKHCVDDGWSNESRSLSLSYSLSVYFLPSQTIKPASMACVIDVMMSTMPDTSKSASVNGVDRVPRSSTIGIWK